MIKKRRKRIEVTLNKKYNFGIDLIHNIKENTVEFELSNRGDVRMVMRNKKGMIYNVVETSIVERMEELVDIYFGKLIKLCNKNEEMSNVVF